MIWTSTDESNPYQNEWNELIDAIRLNKPYNEVKRGVEASLTTSMGRIAAHSGQEITFEELLNSEQEYAPNVDKLTFDSPPPVPADTNGRYPQPEPGFKGHSEILGFVCRNLFTGRSSYSAFSFATIDLTRHFILPTSLSSANVVLPQMESRARSYN